MSLGAVTTATSPSGRTAVLCVGPWADAGEVDRVLCSLDGTAARCVVVDLQHLRSLPWDLFDVLLAADGRLRAGGRRLLLVNVLPGAATALGLLDTGQELTVVTLERVLSDAWSEAGALEP